MKVLVTGGCGFIGSAAVRRLLANGHAVVNVDALTYAANPANLADVAGNDAYAFVHADIRDSAALADVFADHAPDAVVHLAAESHVDRSIDGPADFIDTNIVGTYRLLEAAAAHWRGLDDVGRAAFRFHHVSTDEVYGALGPDDPRFEETTPYDPRSPYSASKAASDHLAMAWHHTFGLPVVLSNCSNNYGPRQFPEKLVPLMIISALAGKPLPVYGQGENVRDWLHVDDHAAALVAILEGGRVGETYLVGGDAERRNIDLVRELCAILDDEVPESLHRPHADLITFVTDRPGHDLRYAIDHAKLTAELGWRPAVELGGGLRATVRWYVDNADWWRAILEGRYDGDRLGLAGKDGDA